MKNILIVDLDGTLAIDTARAEKYIRDPENRQWEKYFEACYEDLPNTAVVELVRLLKNHKFICILSGRSDAVREVTEKWLSDHSIPYDLLYMRQKDDRTQDTELKLKWVESLGLKEDIWMVLEDRQRVVDAWRAAGYTTLQVAPGNF